MLTVSAAGAVVDVYALGSLGPQPEPSLRWLAPSFAALRERNRGRVRDAVFDELPDRGTLIGDGDAQDLEEELVVEAA